MVNPISLVVSTLAAVVFFWFCYETYERKGFSRLCAVIGIVPGFVVFLILCLSGSGMYQSLFAVMVGIAVMCALYLAAFWGRLYLLRRKQTDKKN